MACSECLPTRLNPLAERTCFPQVWPGPTDPSKSTTTGAGTSFGVQETTLAFEVQTYDRFDNPKVRRTPRVGPEVGPTAACF